MLRRFVCINAVFLALIILIGSEQVLSQEQASGKGLQNEADTFNESVYRKILVKEVVEGDTLILGNGEVLKLIGVDTPETQNGGKLSFDSKVSKIQVDVLQTMAKEPLEFAKELMEGKNIRIEFDREKRDMYGMLMGYVFLADSGLFVNAELIKRGYTYNVNTGKNRRYSELFKKLHDQAKIDVQGIWNQWMR